MAKWQTGVITNAGISLLGEVIAGGEITITRAALGGGIVDSSALMAQTALTLPLSVSPVIASKKLVEEKGIDIRLQIRNNALTEDKVMKQVGLFARLNSGDEVLFAIMQDDTGEEIPSETSYPDFMLEFTAAIAMSNTDNITVSVSGGAVITKDALDQALSDYTNTADLNTALAAKANLTVVNGLQNDISSHTTNDDIHVTAAEKSAWDAKADTSDIPTKTSELTNDSGFITSADGGNADMLDGLHAVDFSQIINYGNTSTDSKTAVGIDGKCTVYRCSNWTDYPAALTNGQGHIIAINYKGTGTAGSDSMWVRQIYISANTSITDPRLYQRYISASNVSDWRDIADGGNAATVGGAAVVTSAALGLHRLASGTDEATTTSCPVGCWYGKHS